MESDGICPLWAYFNALPFCSPVDGHVGLSSASAVVETAAANVGVRGSVGARILLSLWGDLPRKVKLLDHMATLYLIFEEP